MLGAGCGTRFWKRLHLYVNVVDWQGIGTPGCCSLFTPNTQKELLQTDNIEEENAAEQCLENICLACTMQRHFGAVEWASYTLISELYHRTTVLSSLLGVVDCISVV